MRLLFQLVVTSGPLDQLMPRDGAERDTWKRWVAEGWQTGVTQACQVTGA
ncbi:type IV secretory system conjugative DNA transfer family protein [Methylobacterium nigriterrae]